jgi:hypothetical protein
MSESETRGGLLADGRLIRLGGSSATSALQENVDIGSTMGTADALDVAAMLAASAREWTGAAVLLGASARLADAFGTIRDSYEAEELRRAERETRSALGEPAPPPRSKSDTDFHERKRLHVPSPSWTW